MSIRQTKMMVALSAAMGLGACGGLDVPDYNHPGLDQFKDKPTRSAVLTAATGLLVGHRAGVAAQNGYVAELGVLGREAFVFDGSEPRTVTELLGPALDPGGPAFGGNFWTNPYANIRNANTLLDAVDKVPGVSDAEKEAIRGFAKTVEALDFLVVINTRDTNGAPIDVNRPLSADLAPIESKEVVLAHIAKLLDEGKAHLLAGGEGFPFALGPGFATSDAKDGKFNTPATFLKFNRAVKARVDVYRGDYSGALTDLTESFLNSTASLDLGVYDTFANGSGELSNSLNGPTIFAHPSITAEAEKKANGDVDDRVSRKVEKVEGGSAADGKLSSDLGFTMYKSGSSPVPVIRNEELILLRAEANIGLGNIPAAADDLNFIRTTSGGLPARFDITAATALDELLKQKRYSLLFEGGHRWLDLRRYGKLETLPRELGDYPVHARFPIPTQETDGRK